jgi:hypothetical protein
MAKAMSSNESIVEKAVPERFRDLGYAGGHPPHLAPEILPNLRDALLPKLLMGESIVIAIQN